jgi:hypothetical protein
MCVGANAVLGARMTRSKPSQGTFGVRGAAFHAKALADFDLSEPELVLLSEVCHALDEVDDLQRALATDGVTVEGSRGQRRVNPAVGELRQHRLMLSRLLAQLALPDEEGEALPSGTKMRAQDAARKRWARDSWHQEGKSNG